MGLRTSLVWIRIPALYSWDVKPEKPLRNLLENHAFFTYNVYTTKFWRILMKSEDLIITEKIDDGICRLMAKGRVDSNSADSLLEKLEEVLEKGQKTIVLNMSQVAYLSSIGIRVILKVYKQALESGGTFNIERPSEVVKNVLGMAALKEMLVTC
jgi:anti-anti-sigma factor